MALRLAIVGLGKIARDQHLPAIATDPRFDLIATVDPHTMLHGVAAYRDLAALIAAGGVDAVAICTPPAVRHALAREAIGAGLHVLLEKPPAATVATAHELAALASAHGVSAFAAWHSRAAGGVAAAAAWLEHCHVGSVRIEWREDIRRWHPGQDWILERDGFGVFDPAINAFSILTALMPGAISVEAAILTMPANREAPVAADIALHCADGVPVRVELDFLQTGAQTWTIAFATDAGEGILVDGGARFVDPDGAVATEPGGEYPRLYARFANLIEAGASEVDARPLALVEDVLRAGIRQTGDPFAF